MSLLKGDHGRDSATMLPFNIISGRSTPEIALEEKSFSKDIEVDFLKYLY